jgi:hypothetical protein
MLVENSKHKRECYTVSIAELEAFTLGGGVLWTTSGSKL